MSRAPESSFFDGHIDALSYIHFIHEIFQFITKILFNRKILENDLHIKLIQIILVLITFDEFLFSVASSTLSFRAESYDEVVESMKKNPRIDMDTATPGNPSVQNDRI